ncbi:MAG: hypothetical protein ACR2PG_04910 [Hyphomicrobiaceae bacterium]
MRTFLISYDLVDAETNKAAITSAIMMLGASWARPLGQTWYIRADLNASDIESVLARLLHINDGLLVQVVEDEAIMSKTPLRWFRKRTKHFETAFDKTGQCSHVSHDYPLAA